MIYKVFTGSLRRYERIFGQTKSRSPISRGVLARVQLSRVAPRRSNPRWRKVDTLGAEEDGEAAMLELDDGAFEMGDVHGVSCFTT